MANKFLLLNKGIANRKGQVVNVVQGGVKVFLKNIYGTKSPVRLNTVAGTDANGNPVNRTVANVEGSYKIDDFMAKQLKYFFGLDLPKDSYIGVRVALWGRTGEALSKFNLHDGDLYMFMANDVKVNPFQRKDNTTGYSLNVTAYDFEPLKTKKVDSEAMPAANTPAASSVPNTFNTPTMPAADYGADDFAAINDSDDLPF